MDPAIPSSSIPLFEVRYGIGSNRRFSGWSCAALAILTIGATASSEAVPRATTLAGLQERLRHSIEHSRDTSAIWGVEIVSGLNGRILFETNATQRLIPASNTKLFTAALALDRLGTAHQVATSLAVTVPPNASGIVEGDLVVRGSGDPSFAPSWHGDKWEPAFDPLVELVTRAGIREIHGNVVVDAGRFRGPLHGRGWDEEDAHFAYGAAVSALTVGDNVIEASLTPGPHPGDPTSVRWLPVDDFKAPLARTILGLDSVNLVSTVATNQPLRVEVQWRKSGHAVAFKGALPVGRKPYTLELPIPNPAEAFGAYLVEALARRNVTVSGSIRSMGSSETGVPTNRVELGSVPSPPVAEWIRPTLKNSQNLYAQLLLQTVGAEEEARRSSAGETAPEATTADSGLRRLPALLNKIGASTNAATLEEGSGLSRQNGLTPHAIVQLLLWVPRQPYGSVWMDSMAVGGVDGTLRNRLLHPAVRGRVRAKTGSLTGVAALSGYVTNRLGQGMVFSIVVNHWTRESAAECRAEIDQLVQQVAEFQGPRE